jgi:Mg2+ and Co2+ transporter CorA
MINSCQDSASTPGVISYDRAILLEFPAAPNLNTLDPSYLTIVLQNPVLVTIRAGPLPAIGELINDIVAEKMPSLSHLIQLVYLIIDNLTDLSIQAETEIRDKTLNVAKALADDPNIVTISDLTNLGWQVDKLVSLIENQLYCVTGLNSSDNKAQ